MNLPLQDLSIGFIKELEQVEPAKIDAECLGHPSSGEPEAEGGLSDALKNESVRQVSAYARRLDLEAFRRYATRSKLVPVRIKCSADGFLHVSLRPRWTCSGLGLTSNRAIPAHAR